MQVCSRSLSQSGKVTTVLPGAIFRGSIGFVGFIVELRPVGKFWARDRGAKASAPRSGPLPLDVADGGGDRTWRVPLRSGREFPDGPKLN